MAKANKNAPANTGKNQPPPPPPQVEELGNAPSPPAPKSEQASELPPSPAKDDGGSGPVRAKCVTECFVRNGRRRAGDVMLFPDRESVSPHFRIID